MSPVTCHFRVTLIPIMNVRLRAELFIWKLIIVCMWMKTNFRNKNYAQSLAFITRFKATRKWPVCQRCLSTAVAIFSHTNSTIKVGVCVLLCSKHWANSPSVACDPGLASWPYAGYGTKSSGNYSRRELHAWCRARTGPSFGCGTRGL